MRDRIEAQWKSFQTEGYTRDFTYLQPNEVGLPFATINGHSVVVWCSNDYLGLRQHPSVIAAARDALQKFGVGSGGTRNISGSHPAILSLEKRLAALHAAEQSLVFNSGFMANWTVLESLGKIFPDAVFFSDFKNHASIIKGLKAHRCEKRIFEHNNITDLAEQLASVPLQQPKWIVFESVYSMDGSIAPIEAVCDLAERFNAMTYLDEVHAVGLYGNGGAGKAMELGLSNKIDLLQGTLGKAFGSMGGYIVGKHSLIELIKHLASGFIFTTSLSPVLCAAAIASIDIIRNQPELREAHQAQVALCKSYFNDFKIPFTPTETHLIPVQVGDIGRAKAIQQRLLSEFGIYVQAIGYPTVQKSEAIFRITPTPLHTPAQALHLAESLSKCLK